MTNRDIKIHVPVLARVEGEGALHLRINSGNIERLHLEIYEPPRLFEQFLVGRSYDEVPDMVARICGICPVAYQISAVNALEDAMNVSPRPWVVALRRALYCGEWIQSHCLHIHMLAAPDFFGFDSAIDMAREYPEVVRRGLFLQGLGNDIMSLIGARSVHPVNVKVGGFHRAPRSRDVEELAGRLRAALPDAIAMLEWAASIPVPADEQEFVNVALFRDTDYPLEAGDIVTGQGLKIGAHEYERHFAEHQEPHSSALFSLHNGKPYLVGPLARVNLARESFPASVRSVLAAQAVTWPSRNMFNSIVARAAEVVFAVDEAARILTSYALPECCSDPVTPRAGVGYGVSEAPRGLLWHRYQVDETGRILRARIVPPTSQNQARIEEDLKLSLLAYGLDHGDDELRLHCEKVIRNYDPCISCATHFLQLTTARV